MNRQNSLTSKATAAASALFISLVLITGTVTTPHVAHASVVTLSQTA